MSAPAPIRRTVGRRVTVTLGCGTVLHSRITGIHLNHRTDRRIITTASGYAFNLTTGAQHPVGDARFRFAD